MNLKKFFAELKRRNVYKVAVAYAIVGWLVMQIAATVVPALHLSDAITSAVVLLVILGFPIALILAWAFELTPEGIKRAEVADSAPKGWSRSHVWLYVIVVAGAISVGVFFLGRYTSSKQSAELPAKSIAVLPFESLSEEKSNAYFAEGIQDEILARLSKIADLKVISRTSTQKYKSAPSNLREIAQQLGVANILEGSVQKAGDQVRITVQLINALNDSHLWADTYDRKMIDMFRVESDLAEKIANTLEAKLTGHEKKEIAARGTNNADAYDAYLHALTLSNRQGTQDLEELIKFGRRAVELDPNYAQAWCLLTVGESQKYFYPEQTDAQLARARATAETAMRLAPDSAEAPAAVGVFNYYCLRNYDAALAQLQIAHGRAPNDAHTLLAIGLVKRRQGQTEESIAVQQEAARLDPLNEDIWANIGRGFRGLRRFEEARTGFERARSIGSNDLELPAQIAETYAAQGDLATAWKIMEPLTFAPTERGFGTKFFILIFERRFDEAERLISAAMTGQNIPPVFRAIARSALANLRIGKGDRAGAQPLLVQAENELNRLHAAGDNSVLLRDVLLSVEANLGHRDEAQKIADSLLETTRNDSWQFPREEEAVARAYVALHDFDRAIPLIEHALRVPAVESLTVAYLRLDPSWDPIRKDPRFQKLSEEPAK
jgi:TolB-like protein/Flp pilus assembly protein TadD